MHLTARSTGLISLKGGTAVDKGEFADRVHAIEDRMYRIAYGQLREAQDRKDAVQESILRAYWRADGLCRR